MSLQMGYCTLELGPTGGKWRALGRVLSVTPRLATLSNKKHVGHLHYPSLGCLIQRDFPLLGQDTKDPNPAGSVEVHMEWENSPGATTRNDHLILQDPSCPFS